MYQENNPFHDHNGVRQVNQYDGPPDFDRVDQLDCPHVGSRDDIYLPHDPTSKIIPLCCQSPG